MGVQASVLGQWLTSAHCFLPPLDRGKPRLTVLGSPLMMLWNQLNLAQDEITTLRPTQFLSSKVALSYLLQINPESQRAAAETVHLLWPSRTPGGSVAWGRSGPTLPGRQSRHCGPVCWGWICRPGSSSWRGPLLRCAGALGSLCLHRNCTLCFSLALK